MEQIEEIRVDADPAARVHMMRETEADPLAAFCRDPLLWGPLAGDEAIGAAMRSAEARAKQVLGLQR